MVMIILFIVFSLRGCASIDETAMPTENESIATPEPIDTQIRDQAIISIWTCMFAPSSCGDELESTQ